MLGFGAGSEKPLLGPVKVVWAVSEVSALNTRRFDHAIASRLKSPLLGAQRYEGLTCGVSIEALAVHATLASFAWLNLAVAFV